jgi:hypothetical protein
MAGYFPPPLQFTPAEYQSRVQVIAHSLIALLDNDCVLHTVRGHSWVDHATYSFVSDMTNPTPIPRAVWSSASVCLNCATVIEHSVLMAGLYVTTCGNCQRLARNTVDLQNPVREAMVKGLSYCPPAAQLAVQDAVIEVISAGRKNQQAASLFALYLQTLRIRAVLEAKPEEFAEPKSAPKSHKSAVVAFSLDDL